MATKHLFANNASTTIVSLSGTGGTTLAVASSAKFPAPAGGEDFLCTLIRNSDGLLENVSVTNVTGTNWTIARGQEGTTPLVFVAGDRVELRTTAKGLQDMQQADQVAATVAASAATITAGLQLKNYLVNGAFQVDQENVGASQTIVAGAALAYCLDQWYAYCTGANVTTQRISQANNTKRLRVTGAASNTGVGIGQRMESIDTGELAGLTATLQLKASSSSLTSLNWAVYYANTTDTFGTLATPTRTLIMSGTWAISATESVQTATFSVPSAAVTGLELVVTGGALLAGQTLTLGDAFLQKGSTATDPWKPPYAQDLVRCYRFAKVEDRTVYVGGYANGPGNVVYVNVPVPVEMRSTIPVVSFGLANNNNVTSANAQGSSRWGTNFFAQAASAGQFSIEFNTIKFLARL